MGRARCCHAVDTARLPHLARRDRDAPDFLHSYALEWTRTTTGR